MIAGSYVSMSASQHHSCGVRDDGTLWCWGGNEHSELAVPGADLARSGVPVQVGTDSDWAEASVGWFHSCGRKQNGVLMCWGRAIEGQLAQERVEPNPVPVKVMAPVQWQRISTGNFHSCGVDQQGALYCTGENGTGQLGLGDQVRRHAFEALP
jgi:alpha-tubulin suppressor-like RCC1 family protein